ncbi:ABC transporter substrate-binding protein [Chloracidobacterium validum]|uniref:ABC transporter substrate-binding protein n=1 Tax=Chloracidobacterium validum TaxID=2821543 RepID=A0ABX8B616_9BACT|nr:ABC transporter substrate-binding protein [Chloracidobacterium validum]QUW01862.1 ABC transporter substrate-binding protein [Chloracidobacterium validum]
MPWREARRPAAVLVAAQCLWLVVAGWLAGGGCRRPVALAADTLVLAVEKPPKTIDPRVGNDAVSARLQQLVFDTLVNKNDQLEIVPELADFTVSPDARVFTFRLRPDIRFHDGRRLTAEDVKYTFESMCASDFSSPKKGDFALVERIETPDAQTVIFRCRAPNLPMLGSLVAVGILPKGTDAAEAATKPIGTGPFKVVAYREQNDIWLEANPDYFKGAPKLKHLRIRFIPDATTRELELRKGTVQLAINADLAYSTNQALGKARGLKLVRSKGTNIAYLGLNCEDARLADVRVRRALALAIDRETIIRTVFRGMARPAAGPLPPEQWAYPADLPPARYDPEEARRLLGEAGYGPERPLRLELKTSSAELSRQVAAVLQEQLKQVGIELALRSFEFQTFLQDTIAGNFQMFYLINVGANQSVDFLSYFYESSRIPTKERGYSEGANRARYRSAAVDGWLRAAAGTTDKAEQRRLYGLVQKQVVADAPQIFLWHPDNVAVAHERVQGIALELSGSYAFLRKVWIADTP